MPTKFLTKPKKTVTAYKSWDTILRCDIFGYPFPVITWSRPLKQLPIHRHVIDGNELTIKNARQLMTMVLTFVRELMNWGVSWE